MIKLDKRLSAVASLVRYGSMFCDVGTDHGFLPIYLVENGIVPSAVASDIHKKPLMAADRAVKTHGLENKIERVLSDGLKEIPLNKVQDIAIAGMGGELIAEILADRPACRDPKFRFLLQPMTKAELLRKYLCENGFSIQREIPAVDGTHCYSAMQVCFSGECFFPSRFFLAAGKIPQETSMDAVFYLKRERDRQLKKANALVKAKQNQYAKEEECRNLAEQIEESIREVLKNAESIGLLSEHQ